MSGFVSNASKKSRTIGRRTVLKLAAGSLAGAIAAPRLIGDARAQSQTTITVWTWGGVERFAPRVAAFKRLYPEAASRIDVQVVSPGKQDPEVYQALRLALTSGGALPDLVQMDYVGMPEFAKSGALTDLKEMLAPYEGDLVDTAKQLTTYDGQVVAIPFQLKPKVWFYRKDLFDQAGLEPAQIKTFDDYIAAGHRLQEKLPKSYIMNIGDQPDDDLYWMMLSNWDDVRVADRDGTYQITKNPAFRPGAGLAEGLAHVRASPSTPTTGARIGSRPLPTAPSPASLIASWMTDFPAEIRPPAGRPLGHHLLARIRPAGQQQRRQHLHHPGGGEEQGSRLRIRVEDAAGAEGRAERMGAHRQSDGHQERAAADPGAGQDDEAALPA